jgi:prolyl-tRNA synthetase
MRQSQLFTKTRREAPSDEVSKNAQLLIRAGFVHKEMAGVYDLLPLGLRVLNKIRKIISEEMEKLGSQELIMSALQDKGVWEKTDRWDDEKVDIWFKSKLKSGNEVGFGWSHEEPITNMMVPHIASYNDLPRYVHQFQTKLRNETRAKSGILRGREFVMKDMYSYCATEEDHMAFYEKAKEAYMNVFKRVGLGDITYVTTASGGFFTDKFSHEFQTLCEAGEDTIYLHKNEKYAVNEDSFNAETLKKLGATESDFEEKKAAEIGNIFTFGTSKCEQLGLLYTTKEGKRIPVFLGSYGIGLTRLMGVLAEVYGDEKGLLWPKSVSPFDVHVVVLESKEGKGVHTHAEKIIMELEKEGYTVLYDDRSVSAGEKFADSDLIGIPIRVVVSSKHLENKTLEIKRRIAAEAEIIPEGSLIQTLDPVRDRS